MSGRRGEQQAKPSISDHDRRFMEDAIRSLPKAAQPGGESAFADKLLNFGYHTNPYVRTFTSVLWSGYALSRGQVIDSDARFRKAREDATLSNVDRTTIAALDSAHVALQESLAPTGSVSAFLDELRERTLQRMWARVCETAMLPPPSFTRLLDETAENQLSEEELLAAEMAEIHAMMKNPPAEGEAIEGDENPENTGDSQGKQASSEGRASDADSDGDEEQAVKEFTLDASRTGKAEQGPELLLDAAAEIAKQLRKQQPEGELVITIQVKGAGKGKKSSGRRRRRRRR